MQEIIETLTAVYRGLDKIQVSGVDNAALLGSCGEGLRSAIRGLQALDALKADQKDREEESHG